MTLRTLELALPFPPSLNRIWRAVGGRIVLSASARAYYRTAANALVGLPVDPFTGRLSVTIVLHPPSKLARSVWDISNREKLANDLLTKQRIWLDDSQIDELQLLRGSPSPEGSAAYSIREIAP